MVDEILSFSNNLPNFSKLSIYIAPNIPEKKLVNAIKSYGLGFVKSSDILLLIDDTLFGSAKEGLFITKEKYFFNLDGDKQNGSLKNIANIKNTENKEVVFICNEDKKWYLKIDSASKNDITMLSEYLLSLVQLLNNNDFGTLEFNVLESNIAIEETKNTSKFLTVLNQHSQPILNSLKENGVQLTSVTLQNDENILKIASIIYNVLPTPVRFLININMVEKFLLENRQWVIDKLK